MRKAPVPSTIVSLALAALVLLPVFYAISASFFPLSDFTTIPARFLPTAFTPRNYVRAFSSSSLPRFLLNSLLTSLLGTFLRLSVCLFAAYSLTTFRYRGRNAIFIILISAMLLPADALLMQNYITVRRMGLDNTYLGLIVTSILSPTAIFLMRQYFLTVSREFREAAYLEGSSDTHFLLTMLLPMSQSIMVALIVQSFTQFFNDYLWPLLITSRESMRTVQVGITMMGFGDTYDFGPLFAAITVLMVPMMSLVFLLRRRVNEGISTRFIGR